MAKENVKVIKIDTDPAKKSLKDLRNELKEFKDQMASLEEGSDAFLEVANKAGEIKHQIDEINESIKGASADFGDMVGNVSNVAAGLTGAFQAVAGGLQAMGIESKAIDESIAKMQGLMAVTQGLGSIDTAIKSLSKLQKSIQSTSAAAKLLKAALEPKVFLAIAAAIAAITFAFNKYNEKQEEAARIQEEYNKKIAEEKRIRDDLDRTKYLNDLNTELRIKKELAGINNDGNDLATQKQILQDYYTALSKINIELNNILSVGPTQHYDYTAELKKRTEAAKQLMEQIEQTKANIEVLEAVEEARNKKAAQDEAKRNKTAQDRLNSNVPIGTAVVPIQIAPIPTETLEEIGARMGKIIADAEVKARHEQWKQEIANIEALGEEFFTSIKESMSMFADSSLGLTSGWISSLDQFQLAFQQTMSIVKDEGTVSWTAYGNVAATALSGVGTMLNALSQEQDASNEEGFEQMKKLQIAATVMNMLSGIMSAWTSAMSPSNSWMTVWGQIAMGTAMSALVAGIGGAQIAKIKSQTMESANPNTNINAKSVNATIIPPVQYSSAVQGASTEGAIKDSKVYVTETDIKNTANKVSVQETENTY